ncbi:hypothetical protein TI05_08795 [Achromatium sp. WMS3]|nr:hypothetical protein TI05_08795 [Achromatium sp. WMS3]
MLKLKESQLDKVTEVFYRVLNGKKTSPIKLLPDTPNNEYAQMVSYINRFITEYNAFAEFMYSLSRGELDYTPPAGRMQVLQSFKSLQGSLRHLTWKTQQIADGDFSQRVDFMGDFSVAFNSMTKQLEQAFTELEHANNELKEKNREITDNIHYAQNIQRAMLPTAEIIHQTFGDSIFIIYNPHSIVSGDFYWLARTQGEILIAVADCTGHGVSGAFLTMIGNTLLNKIVIEDQCMNPAEILGQLHLGVRKQLQQESGEIKDGMDVGLCRINIKQHKVTFAGANRPLYHVSKQQLQQIKGDRKSIGGRQKEAQRVFTNQEFTFESGDTIYLSSDGMADQPNPARKTFGTKQLKTLLSEVASYPAAEQEQRIRNHFLTWKDNTPQRDDITLLGIQFFK